MNNCLIIIILIIILQLCCFFRLVQTDWESWWTYEGISGLSVNYVFFYDHTNISCQIFTPEVSGPDFWGRLNPRWSHCSKGQRQSPIDIDTSTILYDPYLEPIKISGDYVKGKLLNTGRGISLLVDSNNPTNSDKLVTISEGPFSYQYTLSNITLHFGRENDRGSEHSIDGKRFPGELQLYAYNSQLYSNWSEAKREPNGLVAISIFILVARQPTSNINVGLMNNVYHHQQQQPNAALKQITGLLKNITKRGLSYPIESLSIMDLLPSSWRHYVTYEGSLTQPACHETVQWVILNRPIYISSYQFHMLRHSLKNNGHQDNFRPTQPRNKRPIRCNIIHDSLKRTTTNSNNNNKNNQGSDSKEYRNDDNDDKSQIEQQYTSITLKRLPKDHQNYHHYMDHSSTYGNYYESSLSTWKTLRAVKDTQLCLPDQIRLYGYRANRKITNEEL